MASNGIKDRVAIVGMGCTAFGEHWDKGPEDLLVRRRPGRLPVRRASSRPTVDAYWLGTMGSGTSGLMLSEALKIPYKPVTRAREHVRHGQRGDPQRGLRRRQRARTTW